MGNVKEWGSHLWPIFVLLFLVCMGCTEPETSSIYLCIENDVVQVNNSDNEYLNFVNGHIDGTMEIRGITNQSQYGCVVEVSSSDAFSFGGFEEKQIKCSVLSDIDHTVGREYTVSGSSITSTTISPSGKLLINGNNSPFEVFGSMKTAALGTHGNIRLTGLTEGFAEIYFNAEENTVFFDGVTPGFMLISINGSISANGIMISNPQCGIINLSDITNEVITITESSGVSQTIPIETY